MHMQPQILFFWTVPRKKQCGPETQLREIITGIQTHRNSNAEKPMQKWSYGDFFSSQEGSRNGVWFLKLPCRMHISSRGRQMGALCANGWEPHSWSLQLPPQVTLMASAAHRRDCTGQTTHSVRRGLPGNQDLPVLRSAGFFPASL